MNSGRWERFIEFAIRAREKPRFDEEERAPKLEAARSIRTAFGVAQEGGDWLPLLRGIFEGEFPGQVYLAGPLADCTTAAENAWFISTITRQRVALEQAFATFLDEDRSPTERFRSFAEAAGPAENRGAEGWHAQNVLIFGSLFNFAVNPDVCPFLRTDLVQRLEQTLARPPVEHGTSEEKYQAHLQFAEEVSNQLVRAGMRSPDMLDVSSLILLASRHSDFWTSDPVRVRRSARGNSELRTPVAYLSVCAIYRNEAPYIAEWIEFHRLVGVERFFLYDNGSQDDHLAVLNPYVEDGTVVLQHWPFVPGQGPAYMDCLKWHRYESRWIAFIDVDEFLFSPTEPQLPNVLREYETWPGVAVNCLMYGCSGHRSRPAGLVTENYIRRLNIPAANRHIKSIVDPTRTERLITPHHFHYPYLSAVDENHFPVAWPRTKSLSFSRLRINHYHSKSEEEYLAKAQTPRADGGARTAFTTDDLARRRVFEEVHGEDDPAVLRYVPALNSALESRRPS